MEDSESDVILKLYSCNIEAIGIGATIVHQHHSSESVIIMRSKQVRLKVRRQCKASLVVAMASENMEIDGNGAAEHLQLAKAAASSWEAYDGAGEHAVGEEEMYENPPITLVRQEHGSRLYEERHGHHPRSPDLSGDMKVVFHAMPERDYQAVYASHGKSKTVFFVKSWSEGDYLDGEILKVAKKHDQEPGVLRHLYEARARLNGCVLGPDVLYECCGYDNNKLYHCWIVERCIPLNEFAESMYADKEQCVLAACRCMAKAATVGLLLSDCHFFNFGVLVSKNKKEHEVVIIDAGSRGIGGVPKKSQVNECMRSLWQWAKGEIVAPVEVVRKLWTEPHDLVTAAERLDAQWHERPILTVTEMSTEEVEAELRCKCSKALQAYMATRQQKLIALIGASACQGGWNADMSARCFRAGRSVRASLNDEEAEVLGELYERLSFDMRGQLRWRRSSEEIEEIMKFWWKLQAYRKWWLQKNGREDTEAEVLTCEEISEVKADWAWYEMWWELTPEQKKKHLASIYCAALNNKSGWKAVAKCIIKNKMPQLPDDAGWQQRERRSATEHAEAIGDFIEDLASWLVVLARGLAEEHRSERYKRARVGSCLRAERRRYEHDIPVGEEVVERYL